MLLPFCLTLDETEWAFCIVLASFAIILKLLFSDVSTAIKIICAF
jgi:hypothetical protein